MGKAVKAADKTIAGFEKIFIEDPRRAWTIGIFLIIIIVLLVVFWDKIKEFVAEMRARRAANDDLRDYEKQTGEYPSLNNAKIKSLASKLLTAMKGLGTDEQTIYNVFAALGNTADMLALVSAFGTPDGEDLDQWIRGDLSSWEIKKVNGILSSKGISYSF